MRSTALAARADRAPYEQAGAAMLAAQPASLQSQEPKGKGDWGEIYQHLESLMTSDRTWRYSWWQHWAILAQYILPYRYHWVIAANLTTRGFPVNDSIINERATYAMRICASGLFEGLMSEARPWFKLGPTQEDVDLPPEGAEWCDYATQEVLGVLSGSNWYEIGAQAFQDISVFGQAPWLIYEDFEEVIRSYLPCAGEYFLGAGARGTTDRLSREFTQNVQQLVDWFQLMNCPEEVRLMWQQGGGSLNREFVVGHTIEPNYAIASRLGNKSITVVPGSFPYREVYWLRGREGPKELSRRGFREKPFMCPGWSKTSNDPYFRSPGMEALGGSRQLQQMEKRKGEFVEKLVRPPMNADVSLENKPSSILPGEITYVNAADGKQQFWPAFEVQPAALPPLNDNIKQVEDRIGEGFYVPIFMMLSQMEGVQPRNQLEILERKGEKIQQLGPVIDRFGREAAVGIRRVMNIMFRRGRLKLPPASLRGVPVGIIFTSQLKMLQNAAETAAIERVLATMGSLTEGAQAAGINPPLRIVNLDATGRYYAKRLNFPAKLLFSEQRVAQDDAAKVQQAQEHQAAAAALPAVQAAQGLSQIPVGGGQSALGSVLGTNTPPQQGSA